jgi:tripeptide aminopeptidase
MSASLEARKPVQELPEALKPMRERILSNLTMIARMRAPTGAEEDRVQFMLDRFMEAGLTDATADEIGNAVGRLSGRRGNRTILLVSHLDGIFTPNHGHDVIVQADRVIGAGVGDNALGAAVVSMIPVLLDHLGIELRSDLILVGSIGSLGRGNHSGIRFFLDQFPDNVDFGICVEGIQLGRLNFFSVATARADITCDVRSEQPSRSYGSESALVVLNHVINRILGIAVPVRPYTVVRMGKLRAGVAYDVEPDHASLGLEIVSHDDEEIDRIQREMEAIVSEMSARHSVDARLDVFFRTQAGGIPFAHPLVGSVLEVMKDLGIESDQGHSPSELSDLIAREIPAVTLGISRGEKNRKRKPDYVMIEPILVGVAQLIGTILAIDEGACDDV